MADGLVSKISNDIIFRRYLHLILSQDGLQTTEIVLFYFIFLLVAPNLETADKKLKINVSYFFLMKELIYSI